MMWKFLFYWTHWRTNGDLRRFQVDEPLPSIWPISCGTKRESYQWRLLLSQIKVASQGTLLDLDLSADNGLFCLPIEYLSQRCR